MGEHAAHHDRVPGAPGSAARTRSRCCPSTARSACRTTSPAASPATPRRSCMEESSLARVVDPAGGSWYVEQLTDELARAAWDWFQRDRAGRRCGRRPWRSGLVAGRDRGRTGPSAGPDIAQRREPITGVSEFPNLGERPVRARRPRRRPPARGGRPAAGAAGRGLRGAADPVRRAAGRDRGAAGACCWSPSAPAPCYTARSSFAANLFQAGGLETPLSEAAGGSKVAGSGSTTVAAWPDVQALADAFTGSGAAACICSSDAVYAEHGARRRRAEAAGRPATSCWPGRPGDRLEAYRAAGVDDVRLRGLRRAGRA